MENVVYTVICSETENGRESTSVCDVCRSVKGAVAVVRSRMDMRFRQLLGAGISIGKVENRENDLGGQFSMEYERGNRVAWYVAEMTLGD